MLDPLSLGIDALAHPRIAQLPLLFVTGAATSVGPCIAPRYIAIAALLDRDPRRMRTIVAFLAGLVLAYACLGFGAGVFATVSAHASTIDAVLAAALVGSGVLTIVRPARTCAHGAPAPVPARLSGVFALGAASAFVVSPCCTPIVAAAVGLAAFDRDPVAGALAVTAFALGHALPLFFAGTLGSFIHRIFGGSDARSATATVSGTLMIALGGYYGLLV
jgi:cytochrome c biogenesis protein CcdA